ncbi:HAMP domain-containing histidine kinase [Ochrobactrum pseudogrignonense]|nr:HAMP domain-containing histidine kinase [Brucella pseudogrignonensis]
MRNPQASLRPLLQMLQQAEQEDERMMILNNLVRSNDKALRLIEQLLQSGRVNHRTAIGPVNLYDVAASILAELGETIRSKAQDVVLSGCETAWVKTDEALLRLLLENILENAVKYPRHPAGSM